MKFLFLLIAVIAAKWLTYAQLYEIKYQVSHYKDEVNEVIYIAGRTQDDKLMVVKLDKNFTVIGKLTSSFVLEDNSTLKVNLVPPMLYAHEIASDKNRTLINSMFFNEDMEEGELELKNESVNPFSGAFSKGNLIYTYGVTTQLICYKRKGAEITELWKRPIENEEQIGLKIITVMDDNVFLCSLGDATSCKLIKYNITQKKILSTKTIKVDYKYNKCKNEVKFDIYRNHIYIAFLENKGDKGKEQSSSLSVFTLDENFDEVFSPVVQNKVFPKSDCFIRSKFCTFDNSRVTDNCTNFIITEEGVNLKIIHAVNVEESHSSQRTTSVITVYGHAAYVLGITDVIYLGEKTFVKFYEKETLIRCLNNFSDKSKGHLRCNYFRHTMFVDGKTIFVDRKCESLKVLKVAMDRKARPVVFMDVENKKILKESKDVMIYGTDSFASSLAFNEYLNFKPIDQSRFVQSFKGDKILWIYFKYPREVSESKFFLKYQFLVDSI
jgi:hypothetical protein